MSEPKEIMPLTYAFVSMCVCSKYDEICTMVLGTWQDKINIYNTKLSKRLNSIAFKDAWFK